MQEQVIIKLIQEQSQTQGIGDDAVYLEEFKLLVSTDVLIEGFHFLPTMSPAQLGWKTAAVNLSDIAAMGGQAKYFLLGASFPSNISESWIQQFLQGLNQILKNQEVKLIGGDLTRAEQIYLSGTAIGQAPTGKIAWRTAAIPGQKIIVSGYFGESKLGLHALQNKLTDPIYQAFIEKHCRPIPRLQEGYSLVHSTQQPVAMMDASDGLLDCLQQISTQSKVKLKVNLDSLPTTKHFWLASKKAGLNPISCLLTGGEDYELVATAFTEKLNLRSWQVIGEVCRGEGVEIHQAQKLLDLGEFKVFAHFEGS